MAERKTTLRDTVFGEHLNKCWKLTKKGVRETKTCCDVCKRRIQEIQSAVKE